MLHYFEDRSLLKGRTEKKEIMQAAQQQQQQRGDALRAHKTPAHAKGGEGWPHTTTTATAPRVVRKDGGRVRINGHQDGG